MGDHVVDSNDFGIEDIDQREGRLFVRICLYTLLGSLLTLASGEIAYFIPGLGYHPVLIVFMWIFEIVASILFYRRILRFKTKVPALTLYFLFAVFTGFLLRITGSTLDSALDDTGESYAALALLFIGVACNIVLSLFGLLYGLIAKRAIKKWYGWIGISLVGSLLLSLILGLSFIDEFSIVFIVSLVVSFLCLIPFAIYTNFSMKRVFKANAMLFKPISDDEFNNLSVYQAFRLYLSNFLGIIIVAIYLIYIFFRVFRNSPNDRRDDDR